MYQYFRGNVFCWIFQQISLWLYCSLLILWLFDLFSRCLFLYYLTITFRHFLHSHIHFWCNRIGKSAISHFMIIFLVELNKFVYTVFLVPSTWFPVTSSPTRPRTSALKSLIIKFIFSNFVSFILFWSFSISCPLLL